MKVYTEVVWTWDEEKGELVEESSKSHEYDGPIVGAWGYNIPVMNPVDYVENVWKNTEQGWKQNWDDTRGEGDVVKFLNATVGAATGFGGGLLGQHPYSTGNKSENRGYGTSNSSQSGKLLKTQTAGTGSNFGRYGDISQLAPGGWIRQKNKNRDGRSSTLMTRGLSKKQINARHTA